MRYLSFLIGTTFAQTFECQVSADCKTQEIISALNDQYGDLGEITKDTAVCMQINGKNQGKDYEIF